jgi:thiosulfate reductase cytochrome b subunit
MSAVGAPECVRHSLAVRITHWINTAAFAALVVSGTAILLAHPRLYWGETGGVGAPSILDLPLPFMLTGQSGWGRSLHFLSAWVCVGNGLLYAVRGTSSGHFRQDLLSAKGYGTLQRLAYLTVVFGLLPLMIWTGLAMSPAATSVAPAIVEVFGGQQSARTIHFVVTSALLIFLAGHVAMVCLTGFRSQMRGMITGTRS